MSQAPQPGLMRWQHIVDEDSEHWLAGAHELELLVQRIPAPGQEDGPPTFFWLVTSRPEHTYRMGIVRSVEFAMTSAEHAAEQMTRNP